MGLHGKDIFLPLLGRSKILSEHYIRRIWFTGRHTEMKNNAKTAETTSSRFGDLHAKFQVNRSINTAETALQTKCQRRN